MNIPLKYEDVVAKMDASLAREAALWEELNGYEPASPGTASKRARWLINIQDACKYGLPKHLVNRLNNTAKEIQNSIKFGGTKRLRDENESMQQRLAVAEQRAGEFEGLLHMSKELLTTISRHGVATKPNDWCDSFKAEVADRIEKIGAALKPAEEGEGK